MMGRKGRLAGLLGAGVLSTCLLGSSLAEAAPPRRDEGPLYTQIDTGQQAAITARALASKGHCDQALEAYDRALHSSIDMTIRRDRGLCHDQLGHPYPAMDDYRAYLAVSPEAPDSDDIRARLERLEVQTGVGGPSANGPAATAKSAEDVPDEPALVDESAAGTSDNGKRKAIVKKTYDDEEDAYRNSDRALASPLRLGTGAVFGVYGDFRGTSAGGSITPSEEVGGVIRWSFDKLNSLYGQIGYVRYEQSGLSTIASSSAVAFGGIALGLGYELRIRLDPNASNAILLGALFEYQYVTESVINTAENVLIPEGRIGYRRMFGYGFGIEAVGDIGGWLGIAGGNVDSALIWGGSLALLVTF